MCTTINPSYALSYLDGACFSKRENRINYTQIIDLLLSQYQLNEINNLINRWYKLKYHLRNKSHVQIYKTLINPNAGLLNLKLWKPNHIFNVIGFKCSIWLSFGFGQQLTNIFSFFFFALHECRCVIFGRMVLIQLHVFGVSIGS